jgi:hypothetical protein
VTTAKPHHRTARALLIRYLDMHPGKRVGNDLDPDEVGIIGDTAHAAGGDSYHLGRDKIRARAGRDRYSVDESARDQHGLDNNASAIDVGFFQVKTVRGVFDLRDFSVWLVGLCIAGDPDTRDIREVIYSPDGRTVRRWDRQKRRTSGDDSHLFHTHLSEYRDADGHRMVALVTRWLQRIGLLPEEDDMAWNDDVITNPTWRADAKKNPKVQAGYALYDTWNQAHAANVGTAAVLAQLKLLTGKDFTDEQAIITGVLAGLDPSVIAAAIPAELAQQVADELIARLQA